MTRIVPAVLILAALAASSAVTAQSPQAPPAKRPEAPQLAPYVPTPQEVVDRMLALAEVKKGDVVMDLGCGDGRIVITAAKTYGARGIGVDIDPVLLAQANANAEAAGVSHLVTFKLQDAMTADLSEVSVLTLYLLSSSNLKLRPKLTRELTPGSRIVAHNFALGDWEAEKVESVTDNEGRRRTIYRWTVDGKVRQ